MGTSEVKAEARSGLRKLSLGTLKLTMSKRIGEGAAAASCRQDREGGCGL